MTKKELLEAIEDMPEDAIIETIQIDSWYARRYTRKATKVKFYSPRTCYAVKENTIVIDID